MILTEVLVDIALLVKLIFVLIYSALKVFFKNVFIPSKFLYKKVDNEIVLITGAGKSKEIYGQSFYGLVLRLDYFKLLVLVKH